MLNQVKFLLTGFSAEPVLDPALEEIRKMEVRELMAISSSLAPTMLPIWSSQANGHHNFGVNCVAYNKDGTRLASAGCDFKVKLWEMSAGRNTATLKGHKGVVWSVAFSPDGSRLASGSWDNSIKLWEVSSGKEIATLLGHKGEVKSLAFSPDGSRLASGSSDTSIRLWDVSSGKEIATLQAHNHYVNCVAFSPDGERLASGSSDDSVKLWSAAKAKKYLLYKGTGLRSVLSPSVRTASCWLSALNMTRSGVARCPAEKKLAF